MEDLVLQINPLFGLLTRPAMIGGVSFEYHMLNLTFSMCALIGLGFLYGLIFLPLHVVGIAVSYYDSDFFTICYKRFSSLPQMPNQSIWGSRAYEPF